MDASKPEYAKQLKEYLQDQQEPFSLDNYLSERRYMFKNFNSNRSKSYHLYSGKSLKHSINHDIRKTRRRLLQATGILRSLLYKFIPSDDNQEFSNSDIEHENHQYVHGITAGNQITRQTNSSMARLTASDHLVTKRDVDGKALLNERHSSGLVNMFHTFTLPRLRKLEIDTVIKPHWASRKEMKQQSSTEWEWREQIPSDWKEPLPFEVCHFKTRGDPVIPISTLSQKSVGDPMFPSYLRKPLVYPGILKSRHIGQEKLQETIRRASLRRKNRVPQKRKRQLLFDHVDTARESHVKEDKILGIKDISEPKELLDIIHGHFSMSEKQYAEVKRITHLVQTASSFTSEDWRNFYNLKREIHKDIGDAIVDDIVMEIVNLFVC